MAYYLVYKTKQSDQHANCLKNANQTAEEIASFPFVDQNSVRVHNVYFRNHCSQVIFFDTTTRPTCAKQKNYPLKVDQRFRLKPGAVQVHVFSELTVARGGFPEYLVNGRA